MTGREGSGSVKTCNRFPVNFLRAPTEHAFLAAGCDQIGGLPDGVATTGTGAAQRPGRTSVSKQGVEVHRHG